jgi:hypothetical protein
MKKLMILLLALLCIGYPAVRSTFAAEPDFHIGIMTATVSQAEDAVRGAEALIARYGSVAAGGMIQHITHPDNFTTEVETTISQLVGLADDPKMKAIVAVQGPEGTTEAFRRIREKRPDIILISGSSIEDPAVINSAADLCMEVDVVRFNYLRVAGAKKMGADAFVHVSFPRHMSLEIYVRGRDIIKQACSDLGLKFYDETAPDPTSDVGVSGTQQFILEKMPAWMEKYGKNTAFYTTNTAIVEPLIRRIVDLKAGYYPFGGTPSMIKGFPAALNVDLSAEKGDWDAILEKLHKAAREKDVVGRLGTWKYSLIYMNGLALGEHAKRVVEGKAKLTSIKDIINAYETFTPDVKWNASDYIDAAKGAKLKNYYLIYQNPVILGQPETMDLSDVKVPDSIFGGK